jgi:hypothetical protein
VFVGSESLMIASADAQELHALMDTGAGNAASDRKKLAPSRRSTQNLR